MRVTTTNDNQPGGYQAAFTPAWRATAVVRTRRQWRNAQWRPTLELAERDAIAWRSDPTLAVVYIEDHMGSLWDTSTSKEATQ